LLIALLWGAALLLIALILSGSELDQTSARAIGTAIAFAFFGLTSMAGMALVNRRPEIAALGYLTAAVSIAALAFVTSSIWFEDLIDDDWNIAGDAIALAVAGGHASLLLGAVRADDNDAVRLVRGATLATLGLLTFLAVVEISSNGQDLSIRLIGVVAVLYVLGAALLPLIRRMSPKVPDATAPASAAAPVTTPATFGASIMRFDHLVLAVTDRLRSDAFYRDVLGAKLVAISSGRVAYRIGGQQLNVHEPGIAAEPLPVDPVRPGNSDLCFIWDGSIETAVGHLHRHAVQIVAGPVTRVGAHGPGQSVYFQDPDGSLIELISYS